MAHRFTVIFEKEAEGVITFSAPPCQDATRRARQSKKGLRISEKPSGFISKVWWKTVCPSPRKTC